MEELFVENFFKRKSEKQIVVEPDSTPLHIQVEQPPVQKSSPPIHDFGIYLNRLEYEIEKGYVHFADYTCIFHRIRTAHSQDNAEDVRALLDYLEELIELEIFSKH